MWADGSCVLKSWQGMRTHRAPGGISFGARGAGWVRKTSSQVGRREFILDILSSLGSRDTGRGLRQFEERHEGLEKLSSKWGASRRGNIRDSLVFMHVFA